MKNFMLAICVAASWATAAALPTAAVAAAPAGDTCNALTTSARGICRAWYAAGCDATAMTTECNALDENFTKVTGGATAPWANPSVVWDDFSTPSTPSTIFVSSDGTEPIGTGFSNDVEHDLSSVTGTLRRLEIRHVNRADGVSVSQIGSVGGGEVDYVYTDNASPRVFSDDSVWLQYDNVPGGKHSPSALPFDVTDGGTYDTMVLHFDRIAGSTTFTGPGGVAATGARLEVTVYYRFKLIIVYDSDLWVGPGEEWGASGLVLPSSTELDVALSYTDDFLKTVVTPCTWVENGSVTIEWFNEHYSHVYGDYSAACIPTFDLSMWEEISMLMIKIDGADEVVLSGITLEKRN